jgi:hypothetical protein
MSFFKKEIIMGDMADFQLDSEPAGTWWFKRSKPKKQIKCMYCGETGLQWRQVNNQWLLHKQNQIHNCPFFSKAKTTTCKTCNKTGLTWKQENDKWRLYEDDGELHTCARKIERDIDV